MGRVQDAICDALAAEISGRREWDEMPAILPIYVEGGRCALGRLAVPDKVWRAAPTAVVLDALADVTGAGAGLLQVFAPAELHGVAFFSEIWMASAPEGSPEAADLERRAEAAGWRVSTLPDRVEARSIIAVDRAGISYTVFQTRDSDEVKRAVSYPKAGEAFTGAIPAALDKMVTAFLGVTLPDRGRA